MSDTTRKTTETDDAPSEIYVMFKTYLRGKQFDDESMQVMAATLTLYMAGLANVTTRPEYERMRNSPDFMLELRGVVIMTTIARPKDWTLPNLVTKCAEVMVFGKGEAWDTIVAAANAACADGSRLIQRTDEDKDSETVLLPWESTEKGPSWEASVLASALFFQK